tara:strand:- start:1265 stop:1855 length:591 start_codon:yes stop_codon:yes gene_type:complete
MKKEELKFINNNKALKKTDKKYKDETNDCVVYAFMNAFGIGYDKAHSHIKKVYGRTKGKGTYNTVNGLAEMGGMQLVFSKNTDSDCDTSYLNGKTTKYIGSHPKACAKDQEGNAYGTYIKLTNPLYPLGKGEYAGYTLGKFRLQYTKGTYIILVRGHALCVKDGAIVDNPCENDRLFKMTNRDQRRALHIFQVIAK